jgi:hypothetical protein
MSWKNVLKASEVDNIKAIILNYYDDWIDFWSEMQTKIAAYKHIIDPDIFNKFPAVLNSLQTIKERIETIEEQLGGDMTEEEKDGALRIFLIKRLESMKEDDTLKGGLFPDFFYEGLGITEPQKLNYDRLIRRLEMGGGYEE